MGGGIMLQQLLDKFDEWGMEKDGVYYILPQVWKKLDLDFVGKPTMKVVRYSGKPVRMYVLSEQPEAAEQEQLEQTTEPQEQSTQLLNYSEFKQDQTAQQKVQDFITRISEIPGLSHVASLATDEQRKQYFLYIYLNNTRLSFEELFAMYKSGVPKIYSTEEDVLCEIWLDLVSTIEKGEGDV